MIHLHLHTYHSLLDGVPSPTAYLERAKELGMEAIAFTDHGSMGTHLEAQLEADRIGGVKVIFGLELYFVQDHTVHLKEQRTADHVTLLAKNETGYKNLIKLNNIAWRDGFYYSPRIDMKLLRKHSYGLVCLSGCLKGIVSSPVLRGDSERSKRRLLILKNIFLDDFYLEIMPIRVEELNDSGKAINLQALVNDHLIKLCHKHKIQPVVTNDVHFIREGDDKLQTRLVNIMREDFTYAAPDNWLKTEKEMYAAWAKHCTKISPFWLYTGIKNTKIIADKCNYQIPATGEFNMPPFDFKSHPEFKGERTKEEFFKRYLVDKLIDLGFGEDKEYARRLSKEYLVISRLGVIEYFLIVEDLFKFAKSQGVLCHTRGSVNGSLVAFLLGLGVVDPILHGILFERFLSPARLLTGRSDIDIDCDFEAEFRGEAIAYLRRKYGESSVCQVGSYNRLQLRAGIKDMARIEHETSGDDTFSYQQINKITRLMVTSDIERELKNDVFKQWYDKHEDWVKKWVLPIVGNPRAMSIHPAGVVVLPSGIDSWLPIRTQLDKKTNTRVTTTAWENSHTGREDLFARGIMCLDCLGVKTLSIISKTISDIKLVYNTNYSLSNIPLDDKKVYEMFKNGETLGVFQLSAPKITAIIKEMKPDKFEDIIALGALDRPGPLQAKAHVHYIDRKQGNEDVDYMHESLEKVLGDSYGVPIFSEHMMLMATEFAGMDMVQAEKMRQVVKSKEPKVFKAFRTEFVRSAIKKHGNVVTIKADRIWEAIKAFGAYAFPKGHSTAYAIYGNATQYLKVHYPVYFFKNMLNYANHDEYASIKRVAQEVYRVRFVLPDIAFSGIGFVVQNNEIVWPFSAVKGVGEKAAAEIFKISCPINFEDFFSRVNKRVVNKRVMEALIIVSSFSSFGDRMTIMQQYYALRKDKWDGRVKYAKYTKDDWDIEASSLVGFDLLNIQSLFSKQLSAYNIKTYKEFIEAKEGGRVVVVGKILKTHKHKFDKNGKQHEMMFIDMEVDGNEIPIVCWPDSLDELKSQSFGLPKKGQYVIIGSVKKYRNKVSQISLEAGNFIYEALI